MRDYKVRESARAKQVRLTISLRDGLVVVVPRGFDRSRIPGLLEGKARWLDRATARIAAQATAPLHAPSAALPLRVSLPGIGEEWAIEYRRTSSVQVAAAERPGNLLLVYGATADLEACRAALRRWLNRKTHQRLQPWLTQLATERGFQVQRVLVKSQRTRWASCSRGKVISLNVRLLFVEPDLVRYTLLHELCHTAQMNHGKAFWLLLRRHEPDCMRLRRRLRMAWRDVPGWVD